MIYSHKGNALLVSAGLVTMSAFILITWNNSNTTRTNKERVPTNWSSVALESMTARQTLRYFAWTNQSSCRLSNDFGGKILETPRGIYGQKAVCTDDQVLFGGRCTVYSFGVSYDWSFEEAMEKMKCAVFSFDPSMNLTDHRHSEAIYFYRLGLHDRDQDVAKNGWKVRTLSSIYEKLKTSHGDIIDYLKINIEGDEWHVIPHIIQSGMLSKIRQLGVEIHLNKRSNLTLHELRHYVRIIQSLERNGMVRFDSKPIMWSYTCLDTLGFCEDMCYELAWYNRALCR